MKRWHHLHSSLLGVASGLALSRHGLLLFLVGIALGLLAQRLANGVRGLGRAVSARLAHPCRQCGAPIDSRSRAAYCSPSCRELARLERERSERRAEEIEQFGAIPF